MGLIKGIKDWVMGNEKDRRDDNIANEYYNLDPTDLLEQNDGKSNVILIEPRAMSESQQIADHLKNRHAVLVNLKRVTSSQAKRIVDFLSGTIYAIGGKLQKIGGGIFLCTPKNYNVQGEISAEKDGKDIHDNDDINIEW